MKQSRNVFYSLVLFTASYCFADEVVLKNGKILTGEVISEDQEVIILKDSSGIRLHIKKSNVDSLKTQKRDEKENGITSRADEQHSLESESKIPDKPKKKTRVYKKEDLEKMPELTILGSEDSPDEDALRNEYEDRAMQEKEAEAEWNKEALRIDNRIREARDIYENSKRVCDKVIPGVEDLREGVYILSAEQYEERRRYACVEAEAAAKELKNAEAEYEELLEEARKKGIPPGWVDPERIRN
jgi:hypothetical protein